MSGLCSGSTDTVGISTISRSAFSKRSREPSAYRATASLEKSADILSSLSLLLLRFGFGRGPPPGRSGLLAGRRRRRLLLRRRFLLLRFPGFGGRGLFGRRSGRLLRRLGGHRR